MTSKIKTTNQLTRRLIQPSVQLVVAIFLLAVTVGLSRGGPMSDWEVTLFRFIYNWPSWLLPFFFAITQLGSIYLLMTLSVFYVVRRRYHIVLRLLLTGTLAYLLSGVAKDLWGRIRPHEFLSDVVALDYIVRGPGFPSGHTALATALGLTMAHYVRKQYRVVFYILILLVGMSRIYLGLHAPLDIIGGFAIGWVAYALFRHIRLYDTVLGQRRQAAKVSTAPNTKQIKKPSRRK